MELSIVVERTDTGYRAISGAPMAIETNAATRDEAIHLLQSQARHRLQNGVEIINVHVGNHPLMNVPFFPDDEITQEWLDIIAENRRTMDEAEAMQ